MFFVFDISPTQRVMSLICFCCGLQELRIISKLDLLVNQLYIYIYIYIYMCVCVCVLGGGTYNSNDGDYKIRVCL